MHLPAPQRGLCIESVKNSALIKAGWWETSLWLLTCLYALEFQNKHCVALVFGGHRNKLVSAVKNIPSIMVYDRFGAWAEKSRWTPGVLKIWFWIDVLGLDAVRTLGCWELRLSICFTVWAHRKGGAGWRMLASFIEEILTPEASLLLHVPREDNQKAGMLPLDLSDVQNFWTMTECRGKVSTDFTGFLSYSSHGGACLLSLGVQWA